MCCFNARHSFKGADFTVSSNRGILYFLNIVLCVWGAVLIYAGVRYSDPERHALQVTTLIRIRVIAITVICFGPLMIIMAIVGSYTGITQNRGWCGVFSISLLVIGAAQLCIGNVALMLRNHLETPINDSSAIMKSFRSIFTDRDTYQLWDRVQDQGLCCGVRGPEDYRLMQQTPLQSCCVTEQCDKNRSVERANKKGCLNVFVEREDETLMLLGDALVIASFIMFSGIAMLTVGDSTFVVAPDISSNNPLLRGVLTNMEFYTLLKVAGGFAIIAGLIGVFTVIAPVNVIVVYVLDVAIVLLVVLDLTILVKAVMGGETTDEKLTENLLEKTHSYDTDSNIGNAWDSLHDSSSCCGAEGPFDWLCSIDVIPASCCPGDMTVPCNGQYNDQLYQKGCVSAVRQTLTSVAKLVGAMVTIQMVIALSILTGKVFKIPYC